MFRLLTMSVLALVILSSCSSTQNVPVANIMSLYSDSLVVSPNDIRQYRTLTLANEIDVILVSDPSVEQSAAALSVGVGSLHDPMTQQGMAHYLEHMLFLGTERYPDSKAYSEFMTKNGGAHNAYTGLDITNYMFKVNSDAYDEALDRFSDFFKSPKLYPEYTEKEKHAVNAEWSMRRDADFRGQFKLSRNMMGSHPANRFTIGNLETLSDKQGSALHEETVRFYNKYYSSNIMKLVMLSNESLDVMAKKAQQYFANIPNKKIKKPIIEEQIDFSKLGKKRVYYVPNKDVQTLRLDFTIDNNSDEFALKPNYFIAYLLNNEMTGSPAQVLKEQGLISQLSVWASPEIYGNYGMLVIDIELTDAGMKEREKITATVMQYIDVIREKGVDSRYFDEIRTSLSNQFRFLEKADEFGYVSKLADSMQRYPLNHAINAEYYYAQFNQKAVNEVLAQLTPERMRVWYISQKEPHDQQLHFYDGQYKISNIADAEIANWKNMNITGLALPSVNKLLPENFMIKTTKSQADAGVVEVFKDSRTTIWHTASKDFSHQPKGVVNVYINSAKSQKDVTSQVVLSIWSELYQIAESKLIAEASVAGMGLSLAPRYGLILTASGFTDKQHALLGSGLKALDVEIEQTEFEQAIGRYKRKIFNQQKQFPIKQAFDAYHKITQGHSYSATSYLTAADNLTLAEFKRIKADILTNNQIRVFAFGNYNQQDLVDIAALINQVLPKSNHVTDYAKIRYLVPREKQVLVMQKDIDVADVAIIDIAVHPVPGYKQKAQSMVLGQHLQHHIFERLRTQEQLAYVVNATSRSIGEYAALGFFIQTPVKDVQSMQQRFERYKQEYAAVITQLDHETFEQLKNAVLVSLNEPAKNLSEEMRPLLLDWHKEQFDYDSKQKLITEVEKVTLADIQTYYKETMMNPDAARINVQLRGNKFQHKSFADLPNQTLVKDFNDLYQLIELQK